MYEITHRGAWFKWSNLDRAEKRLAAISLGGTIIPAFIAGIWLGDAAARLGFRIANGRTAPNSPLTGLSNTPYFDAVFALALMSALISGIAWWRFSLRQDEMFNRVQNYALGQAGAWSLAAATLWWFLRLPGWVGDFPLGGFVIAGYLLILAFWFIAVRRWA